MGGDVPESESLAAARHATRVTGDGASCASARRWSGGRTTVAARREHAPERSESAVIAFWPAAREANVCAANDHAAADKRFAACSADTRGSSDAGARAAPRGLARRADTTTYTDAADDPNTAVTASLGADIRRAVHVLRRRRPGSNRRGHAEDRRYRER